MLDRSQLLHQLHALSGQLFIDFSGDFTRALQVWENISRDASYIYRVRSAQTTTTLLLPTWDAAHTLSTVHAISSMMSGYRVISVDGSQIYPDRHQGTSCFLINVGVVMLSYGLAGKNVHLSCWPTVYNGHELSGMPVSTEVINGQREEAELRAGVDVCTTYANKHDELQVLLFDGSLIFWHLEAHDARLRDRFLPNYMGCLQELYEKKMLVAGYISAPRSRELVNLIKLRLFDEGKEAEADALPLVDLHIAHFFLSATSRSIVFKNHASICQYYPEHLHPHFFYLSVGDEIGRVEIPAWIAAEETLVDQVAQVIIDQCKKGYGYPVAIAEAHEQAVIKGADRDFFYCMLNKLSVEHKQRMLMSQKSIKKRRASF
jgi:hypothetical protein